MGALLEADQIQLVLQEYFVVEVEVVAAFLNQVVPRQEDPVVEELYLQEEVVEEAVHTQEPLVPPAHLKLVELADLDLIQELQMVLAEVVLEHLLHLDLEELVIQALVDYLY